jgi:hypothetical protein
VQVLHVTTVADRLESSGIGQRSRKTAPLLPAAKRAAAPRKTQPRAIFRPVFRRLWLIPDRLPVMRYGHGFERMIADVEWWQRFLAVVVRWTEKQSS